MKELVYACCLDVPKGNESAMCKGRASKDLVPSEKRLLVILDEKTEYQLITTDVVRENRL